MATERMTTKDRLRVIDSSLHSRAQRVRQRSWFIVQSALSAGLAYYVAHEVVGHTAPFFAPIAAVVIMGLSGGDRIRRAFEMSIGCSLGIGVGDLLFLYLGPGYWQITVAVLISLLFASFASSSPLVNNQVAIGAILIATIMPPGTVSPTGTGGPERMIDAIIGCVVGLLVIALLPNSPLGTGRHKVSKILSIASSVLHDVSEALKTGDIEEVNEALSLSRATQGDINAMIEAAKQSKETTTLSPFLWGTRRRVRILQRILPSVDNVVRNTRVLARRSTVLNEDHDAVSEEQVVLIDELSDITLQLSEVYEKNSKLSEAHEIPVIVRHLQQLGSRCTTDLVEGRVLSAWAILAQTRSIIVDVLQICGMSRESALASLAPTSATPAYPPELPEQETGTPETQGP